MRPEALRFLLASLGFALLLGVAGPGVLAPSAQAAVFAHPSVIGPQGVVADAEGGSDDTGDEEDDEGEEEEDLD